MLAFRLKNLLSRLVGQYVDLDKFISRKKDFRVVLAYHRILPNKYAERVRVQDAMWVSTDTFRSQLDWMLRVGVVVPLKDILDFTRVFEKPAFAITFDDGWIDNYQYAFPLLKMMGAPATIFLATAAIESGKSFWIDKLLAVFQLAIESGKIKELMAILKMRGITSNDKDVWGAIDKYIEKIKLVDDVEREAELESVMSTLSVPTTEADQRDMMSWSEIKEMMNFSVDFQSHTHNHKILKYLNDVEIAFELEKSKKIIESHLCNNVDTFCYPNARYPEQKKDDLYARCGYKFGVKIDNKFLNRSGDPYLIPRLLMSQDNSGLPAYFKFRLLGIPKY